MSQVRLTVLGASRRTRHRGAKCLAGLCTDSTDLDFVSVQVVLDFEDGWVEKHT